MVGLAAAQLAMALEKSHTHRIFANARLHALLVRYSWFCGTKKECPTLMQQLGLVKLPQPGPWADRRGYNRLVAAGLGSGERNEALGADVRLPGLERDYSG